MEGGGGRERGGGEGGGWGVQHGARVAWLARQSSLSFVKCLHM